MSQTPAKALATAANAQAPEKASSASAGVKGPPLGSSSHTVRLLMLLTLNSLLVFLCLFVLPAHLLWRQAIKQETLLTGDSGLITPPTSVSDAAREAVALSTQQADSALRNLRVAFGLLFSSPNSDAATVAWIRRGARSTLAPVVLSQAWFVARLKGWWDEAEAMERGDREEVMKRRRIGIGKQMEHVTLTTFALPLVTVVTYVGVVVCGAPIVARPLDTVLLAAYLAVMAFFPAIHLMGTEEREWIKAFSSSPAVREACIHAPRFRVLVRMASCTLVGTLIGSVGGLLDWDKAWQTYPVPSVLGGCLGLMFGNLLAATSYFFSTPSRSAGGARVERKQPSAASKAKAKAKAAAPKKKKQK